MNQTLSPDQFEVVLVDAVGHPTYKNLLQGIGGATNIKYEQIPSHGRARALNHALSIAQSDLVIFLADDFVVDANFVSTHVQFHAANPAPESVAIGASFIPINLQTEFTNWLESTGRFFGIPFRETMKEVPEDFFYVGNASVKRELLDRAGAFDEVFLFHAGDDFEFGQRLRAAGMKAQLAAGAQTSHRHHVNLEDRAEAFRQLGQNARAVADRDGEATWLRSLKLSAPIWSSRTAAARAIMLLNETTATRQRWWRTTLDAAFAAGYRHGHNGNRPE